MIGRAGNFGAGGFINQNDNCSRFTLRRYDPLQGGASTDRLVSLIWRLSLFFWGQHQPGDGSSGSAQGACGRLFLSSSLGPGQWLGAAARPRRLNSQRPHRRRRFANERFIVGRKWAARDSARQCPSASGRRLIEWAVFLFQDDDVDGGGGGGGGKVHQPSAGTFQRPRSGTEATYFSWRRGPFGADGH